MSPAVVPASALVLSVGLERYAYGAGMDLPGAAAEAVRFVRWALRCGVPPERVLLGCSWLGTPAQAPAGVRLVGTTERELSDAVRETAVNEGDVLLVFWCGHGVVNEHGRRALFTADASRNDKRNIVVDELLAYLRSSSLTGFGRQILLLDACANSVVDMQFDETLPQFAWQKGNRERPVTQFAYFSAAQGQIAQFNKIERYAMFSTTALRWLEEQPTTTFPPDVVGLKRHVDAVFERLREAGQLRQVPVYLRVRTYDGSEDDIRYLGGGIPVAGAAQAAIRASGMTVSQLLRVATAVTAIPDLSTADGRNKLAAAVDGAAGSDSALLDLIIHRLAEGRGDAIVTALDARATSESDVLLVRQVENCWRRQQWFAPALRVFRSVTGEEVRNAYFRAAPAGDAETPADLDDAMDLAARYGRPPGKPAPLHRLVAALEHMTQSRVDDDWYGLPADRLHALRLEAATTPSDPVRLVIDLRPSATGSMWPDEAVGHLYFPGKGWNRSDRITCEPTAAGAQRAVAALIRWAEEDKAVPQFTVGLIVPRAGLDALPEAWEFGNPLEDPTPLWHQRSTVLHSAERLGVKVVRDRWEARVAEIKKRLVNDPPEMLWIDRLHRDSPASSRAAVRDVGAACVGLAFAPGAFCHDLRQDPIIAMITGGAPYLLWVGREPADWLAAKRSLVGLVVRGAFDELPDRLHRARTTDADGLGGSLRLMWDEPGALPPIGRLVGILDGSNHG